MTEAQRIQAKQLARLKLEIRIIQKNCFGIVAESLAKSCSFLQEAIEALQSERAA
jgi:acyl-CoA synthetase (NDP forming)